MEEAKLAGFALDFNREVFSRHFHRFARQNHGPLTADPALAFHVKVGARELGFGNVEAHRLPLPGIRCTCEVIQKYPNILRIAGFDCREDLPGAFPVGHLDADVNFVNFHARMFGVRSFGKRFISHARNAATAEWLWPVNKMTMLPSLFSNSSASQFPTARNASTSLDEA